jgi:hypothetical protein
MEMDPTNFNPALYQLIGPIETLYQLVPIGGGSRLRRLRDLRRRQTSGGNGDDPQQMLLVPIPIHNGQQPLPLPYLDNHDAWEMGMDMEEEEEAEEHTHFHLLAPIGGLDGDDGAGLELVLFNEVFPIHVKIKMQTPLIVFI